MPTDHENKNELLQVPFKIASDQQGAGQFKSISDERRVDLLVKVYREVSNYDRHYSTTRSGLTALLITVALAASRTPLNTIIAHMQSIAQNEVCGEVGASYLFRYAILPMIPAILLFFIAILINFHFQRLTASCAIIEQEIERLIMLLSPGTGVPVKQNALAKDVCGYSFRVDMDLVYRRTGPLHFDTMKKLLVFGILLFLLFAVAASWLPCSPLRLLPGGLSAELSVPVASGGSVE